MVFTFAVSQIGQSKFVTFNINVFIIPTSMILNSIDFHLFKQSFFFFLIDLNFKKKDMPCLADCY